jgi:predicted secreted protein
VLRSASLVGADLRGADLTAADLTGADLRGARLESADQPNHGGTMPELTPHLTETDDGAQLRVSVGQAIEIALGEGTTGYQWRDDSPADQPLVLSSSDFAPPTQTAAGAFGQRHFRFEAVRPGPAAVHLVLQQPWDLDSAPDRTFEVGVEVSP